MASAADALNLFKLIRMGLSGDEEKAKRRLQARLEQPQIFGTPFEVTEQDRADYAATTGGAQWPQKTQSIADVIRLNNILSNREGGGPHVAPEPQTTWATPLTQEQMATKKAQSEAIAKLAGENIRQQELTNLMPTGQGAPTIADIFSSVRGITRQKPRKAPSGKKEETVEEKYQKLSRQMRIDIARNMGMSDLKGLDPQAAGKVNQMATMAMQLYEQLLPDNPRNAWNMAIEQTTERVEGQSTALKSIPGRREKFIGEAPKNIEDAKAAVKMARNWGAPDEKITHGLLSQGWKPAEVQQIMGGAGASTQPAQAAGSATQSAMSDEEAQARYNRFRSKGYSEKEAAAMAYGDK